MSPAMTLRDLRVLNKGALQGFGTFELPSGMVISDVSIFCKDGRWWASPPGKPMIGRDGCVVKDASGNVQYNQIITFASRNVADAFSNNAITALRKARPEMFAS